MKNILVDLVMNDGNIIAIECPVKNEDEFWETLKISLQLGNTWSTVRFDGCRATYLGHLIQTINMKNVVGVMS